MLCSTLAKRFLAFGGVSGVLNMVNVDLGASRTIDFASF